MADGRLYNYAMKAFGLQDMAYAKAFIRKALTEGVDDDDSFANKLTDPRYSDFVETFNFARHGAATTVFDRTRQGTVDRYLRQTLEEDAGKHERRRAAGALFRAQGVRDRPVPSASWPIAPCSRWCRPRLACRPRCLCRISTSRPS